MEQTSPKDKLSELAANVEAMNMNPRPEPLTEPIAVKAQSADPDKPWYRQEKIWALIGIVVMIVGIALSSAIGQTAPFAFLITGIVVFLVLVAIVVNSVTRMRDWMRRNRKRIERP